MVVFQGAMWQFIHSVPFILATNKDNVELVANLVGLVKDCCINGEAPQN